MPRATGGPLRLLEDGHLSGTSILLLLLVGAYVPFLGGGLLTDDFAHVNHLSYAGAAGRLFNAPDAFGFYRPIPQLSMYVDVTLLDSTPSGSRAVNLALHAAVLAAAFAVARRLFDRTIAASFATIAFALTPKAHPIAVLWISARAELLMALFSLIAVAAWIRWSRGGRSVWLGLAFAGYVAALMSKEAAFLLPLLLLFVPGASRPWRSRVTAILALGAAAIAIIVWRAQIGALMPASADAHYSLVTTPSRLSRNLQNYAGRMTPAPLGLVVVLAIAALPLAAAIRTLGRHVRERHALIAFGLAWCIVFLAPVLPIVARNELYLYMPAFGVCLIAGSLAESAVRESRRARAVLVGLGIYVAGFGLYQASRSLELHRDLDFSEALVAALERSEPVRKATSPVVLVAGDPVTDRFLRDAIGGYLPVVLQRVFPGKGMTGAVDYDGTGADRTALRLVCEYSRGRVTLR
jgi:hypothetical protein